MESIRCGLIAVVLCIELSRLSRDDTAVQYLQFIDLCRSHGVKLATPGQVLDPDDPSQWLILMMQGGLSSVEMQQLKRRMAEGRLRARESGQYLGGPPPWPYKYVGDKKIAVTPEDKAKAREVLRLLQHSSVWDVSQRFPELSPATLARITTRQRLLTYTGKCELDDGTIIDCDWEPIITEDEMRKLRKASSARLPYRRTGRERPSRLLTGLNLFLCAYCNRTMKGHPDKKKLQDGQIVTHQYYRCNRYKVRIGEQSECKNQSVLRCSDVDEPLLVHVQHTLDRIADIKEAFDEAVRTGQSDPRSPALKNQLDSAQKRRDRLVDRIADGLLTDEEARPALTRIRDEIDRVRAELADINQEQPEQLDVLDEFQDINLANYSLEEKRELLTIVVKDIRLRFDRLFITYNLYEAPGRLYKGEIKIPRNPSHNSKLRRR